MAAPLVALAFALLVAALFAQAFVRLRRRGRSDHAGWGRAGLVAVALLLWLLALSPQMDEAADRLLAAHMLEHVLIGDAVPALLILAVRGPLTVFLVPAPLLKRVARSRRLRGASATLVRPAVAFGVWAAALAVWHVPALYDRTLASGPLHALQHASFVLGGTLVWLNLIDPARRGALSPRLRIAFALGLFVSGQALANTLVLTYWPLYPAYANQPERLFGLSPLADQDAAALVMMAEQLATLGTFAALRLRGSIAGSTAAPGRHPLVT
jgi:putative membrane protein